MGYRQSLRHVVAGLCIALGSGTGALALPAPFINEIHYDNAGADVDEFVEVAGVAGTSLAGWALVLYNGMNGAAYVEKELSGTIPDQDGGFGTLAWLIRGIQNGAPDGIALVSTTGVLQFLSYEGSFFATNGPALGMLSTDIGAAQGGSDAIGRTLQLQGAGTAYADFEWSVAVLGTMGEVNLGQSFVTAAVPQPQSPALLLAGLVLLAAVRMRRARPAAGHRPTATRARGRSPGRGHSSNRVW